MATKFGNVNAPVATWQILIAYSTNNIGYGTTLYGHRVPSK